MDFQVVKTGEKLSLGKKTLSFIEAPMIHWPDSMFTYLQEDALLLPNDAFGQHIASSARFDDEVDPCALMQEAAKYYANILWPLGQLIDNKIKELLDMNIPIRMIAPSHGIIWRKDPGRIISAYQSWAQNTVRRKAVVLFETMWGSTEKMARRIVEGITDSAVEVKLFDIAKSDPSDVVTEMLDAQGFVAGSSTYDNDMLPKIAGFLEYLKGAKPRKRIGAAFGSFGWGGGAVKEIESVFKEAGIDTVQSPLSVKYVPSTEELENCYAFGKAFAEKIKQS
jgi:flavorubredoxin